MTDITPELEKVAAAVYGLLNSDGVTAYITQPDAIKYHYRKIARAALLAIREPSEGMHEAANLYDSHGETETSSFDDIRANEHRAMIDHILGVKPE